MNKDIMNLLKQIDRLEEKITQMNQVIENYDKLSNIQAHEIKMLRSLCDTPKEVVDKINQLSPRQLELIVDKQVQEMINESSRN